MNGIWYYSSAIYLLFPLMLIIGLALGRRYLWQKRTAEQLGGTGGEKPLLRHFSLIRAGLKALFFWIGIFFLIVALARPQWGQTTQTVTQEGRDILIALDISRSMLAQDIKPSRLEAAKAKIRQLVLRLKVDRVSLMVFSGVAIIQCPFTRDTAAFLNFLDLADTEAVSEGSTALDKAINEAIRSFESVPARAKRLMILFTDGEDFSMELSSLEGRIKELGLRIFTIGVGTSDGAPIPLYEQNGTQEGYLKDDDGVIVISRLNEQLLSQLASQTGAYYTRITQNSDDVDKLVASVERFEREKFDDATFTTKEERYMLFAGLSAFFLLCEWLL